MGYRPREQNDYDGPPAVPGRGYIRDRWRWLRVVLVILFLLFDLAGLVLLLFPGAISLAQSVRYGPQTFVFPTFPGSLPGIVAAAPSVTPTAGAAASTNRTASPPPGSTAIATLSPKGTPASVSQTRAPTPGLPGVYVESLRLDPSTPRRNQDIYFYITFLNTTRSPQNVRWDILVYRPDNLRQYFGQSLPVGKGDSIAPGTQELRSFGAYKLFGGGGCESVVIRIGRFDQAQPVTFIDQPDGRQFSQTIILCP